jgi:hypothetical protein
VVLRLRGCTVVWTAHNLYPHDGGNRLRVHRLARRVMIACSQVVFVHGLWSGAIVQLTFRICARKLALMRHGHWIAHYPNGIERSAARRRLGIPEAAYFFLFVGICKEYKGLDSLVRSFAGIAPGSATADRGRISVRDVPGDHR